MACGKTLISTFAALRRFHLGVRICPAAEKTCSQGAADAGVASQLYATYLASFGHLLFSFCFQKVLKLNSYVSAKNDDDQWEKRTWRARLVNWDNFLMEIRNAQSTLWWRWRNNSEYVSDCSVKDVSQMLTRIIAELGHEFGLRVDPATKKKELLS